MPTVRFELTLDGFSVRSLYQVGVRRHCWERGSDLNGRSFGYEPNEIPGFSTPQFLDREELNLPWCPHEESNPNVQSTKLACYHYHYKGKEKRDRLDVRAPYGITSRDSNPAPPPHAGVFYQLNYRHISSFQSGKLREQLSLLVLPPGYDPSPTPYQSVMLPLSL